MRGLVESTPDAVVVVDAHHRIVLVNAAAERIFGYTQLELVGSPVERLVPEAARERHLEHHDRFMREPRERPMGTGIELTALHRDGHEFPAEISLRPVRTDEGLLVATMVRDVSELRRARETSAWLTAMVESSGDAIVGVKRDGRIASWNPAAERLYGYTSAEALGRPAALLAPPECRAEQEHLLTRTLAGETVDQLQTVGLRKDAGTVQVAATASPIRDADGQVLGEVLIVRDVTEHARFEQELKLLADHDALTGLFNRRRFTEELARHVARLERYPGTGGALLLADLDNLKHANDTLGHHGGDELLKAVARVLKARLRETDVLARLGGDEFAMLLPRASVEQAVGVAETLCAAARTLELVIDGHRLHTTVSVGATAISSDMTAAQALAWADAAMYEAKRHGRNRVAGPTGRRPASSTPRPPVPWAARLRAALDGDSFDLYAQPIVRLADGTASRHELLLRMRESDDLVAPNAFLAAAERFGLICDIDRHVLRRAIGMLSEQLGDTPCYHVNLSGASIAGRAVLDFMACELRTAGVDPARLTLEVTESAATFDMDAAQRFAHGVQELGCTMALDSFGSGFGSFACLKYVPVRFLKLDGALVEDLAVNAGNQLLVKAIIDVAHGLRVETIAKNVTCDAARTMLEQYTADYGQGYHLGQPQPLRLADS